MFEVDVNLLLFIFTSDKELGAQNNKGGDYRRCQTLKTGLQKLAPNVTIKTKAEK